MTTFVPLGEIVGPAAIERAGTRNLTVLSMTSSKGLVPQSSVFKKRVASRDLANYKIVRPNQLVVGIHIDEGAVGFSGAEQVGIVSPAYTIWDLQNPASIHVPYLERFIRSPRALTYFASKYRETAERRGKLTKDQFLSLSVPLPDVAMQRRIASILDKSDTLRIKRREALVQLDRLARSIFLEMFGDTRRRRWPVVRVEEVAASSDGAIRTGPFGSQLLHSEFVDEGIAVLGIDNAVANEFRWGERRFITEAKYRTLRRYTVKPGDVLITIMGTCGRCAVVPDDIPPAINTKHLCCITLDKTKCLPTFLHSYFLWHPTARHYLAQTSKGAIMDGLNMGIIRAMPIVTPPVSLQEEFSARLDAIDECKAASSSAVSQAEALFTSVQHRAFRGEL